MALKEKALRRLGEKLTAANIPFAAGGEWLRCQLGQSAVYHTFDIADVTLETSGSAVVLGTSIPLLTESAWDAVAQLLQ